MKDISEKLSRSQITDEEAKKDLQALIGSSDDNSPRWQVFESGHLKSGAIAGL